MALQPLQAPGQRARIVTRLALASTLALAGHLAHAEAEPAVTKRPVDLRSAPGDRGAVVAALPARSPVTRLGDRQGGWVRVATPAGATGWLHLFDVAPGQAAASAPAPSAGLGGALRGVTSLFTRGSPSTGTSVSTSTLGVRGLGAEDIAQAHPDTAAVARMEMLRTTERDARSFAASAGLAAVAVEPLPAARPAPAAPAAGDLDASRPEAR